MELAKKQAHWNVKGPTFIALHELFDAIHTEVLTHVDNLAELIVTMEGVALGIATGAAQQSGLPAYPLGIVSSDDHVEAVSTALAAFGGAIREAIATAGDPGDAGMEDLFVEVSRAVDKSLWMVEGQWCSIFKCWHRDLGKTTLPHPQPSPNPPRGRAVW